ncbi:MAG: signal peptidase I [Armatimonadetes bacterium]|nr:signal peptidase I [Armatimonadota bacterium]
MIAFDRPWHVVGLIGLVVLVRVAIPRLAFLGRSRPLLIEFDDSLLIALLVVFCVLRPFVIQAFYIPSGSMLPTLQEKDRILVLKFWYRVMPPRPGDIVVFRAPKAAYYSNPAENHDLTEQKDFIKRLVGCPGDRLRVNDYALFRDGKPVEEPYLEAPPVYGWPLDPSRDLIVPPGQYVVLGDNRNNSNDSHRWMLPTMGRSEVHAPFVPRDALLGRAWLIFYPFERVRLLH